MRLWNAVHEPHRTSAFSLGAEARRVLVSDFGFGSSRKRVWLQAKSTTTSNSASARPHGQAKSVTSTKR